MHGHGWIESTAINDGPSSSLVPKTRQSTLFYELYRMVASKSANSSRVRRLTAVYFFGHRAFDSGIFPDF